MKQFSRTFYQCNFFKILFCNRLFFCSNYGLETQTYFRLNQTLDRQDAGVTMPPQGLILTKIAY